MSAQERDAEVVADIARIMSRASGHRGGNAKAAPLVYDALLAAGWSRPVSAGGEVEAATDDALARAVMGVLQCHVQPVCDGSCNTGLAPCNGQHEERECYEHEDPERVPFMGDVCWLAQSVVDVIRPLLAGGVPGRSEAEAGDE